MRELYKGTTWFPSDVRLNTPDDCLKAYAQGLAGAFIDHEATDRLEKTMEFKSFTDVMSMWAKNGIANNEGGGLYLNGFASVLVCEAVRLKKLAAIVKPTLQLLANLSSDETIRPWDEKQDTGDCVSHGTRNHNDYIRSSEIVYQGDLEDWVCRTATEIHYGARGHAGEGANSGTVREFVKNVSGMFLRMNYPQFGFDLSTYNSQVGIGMGRTGVPKAIRDFGAAHPMTQLTRCRSLEEAVAAYRAGFSVSGGGMHSFSSTRNEIGYSQWTGPQWAHDTALPCMDERPDTIKLTKSRLFLYQNSWWKWNSGGRKILNTNVLIPHGSMWIDERSLDTMIRNGEYYIVSGAKGWAPLKLVDYGFTGNV